MWSDFIAKQRSCLVVGRGPTAQFAARYVPNFGAVFTVNEICLDVPGTIDLAVFVDDECIQAAKPAFDRIRWFLCPTPIHRGGWCYDATLTPEKAGIPPDRLVTYPLKVTGRNEDCVRQAMAFNAPCLCWTITSAIHAAALLGYREIYCIGTEDIDGVAKNQYAQVRADTKMFVKIMDECLGTVTRFWTPKELEGYIDEGLAGAIGIVVDSEVIESTGQMLERAETIIATHKTKITLAEFQQYSGGYLPREGWDQYR